jgi:hypothetical protein
MAGHVPAERGLPCSSLKRPSSLRCACSSRANTWMSASTSDSRPDRRYDEAFSDIAQVPNCRIVLQAPLGIGARGRCRSDAHCGKVLISLGEPKAVCCRRSGAQQPYRTGPPRSPSPAGGSSRGPVPSAHTTPPNQTAAWRPPFSTTRERTQFEINGSSIWRGTRTTVSPSIGVACPLLFP